MVRLSYESLKIEQKANDTLPFAIKRTIKNDVVDYFDYIHKIFIEMDKVTPYKFDTLAAQIKGFYCKTMQVNPNQEFVYASLVDWLNEKTGSYSRRACKGDFNPNHRLKNSRIHNRIRHIHKDYLYLSRICSKDNSFRLVLRAKALLNL